MRTLFKTVAQVVALISVVFVRVSCTVGCVGVGRDSGKRPREEVKSETTVRTGYPLKTLKVVGAFNGCYESLLPADLPHVLHLPAGIALLYAATHPLRVLLLSSQIYLSQKAATDTKRGASHRLLRCGNLFGYSFTWSVVPMKAYLMQMVYLARKRLV